MMNAPESSSTRPYLIRALYEWCSDNGYTPYVAVLADETVQVPREYVKNGEIVLNISFDATSSLKLGNEFIEFKARFAGTAREIVVPISRVMAIYARENGQGMAFPIGSENAPEHNSGSLSQSTGLSVPPDGRVVPMSPADGDAPVQADPPEPPRPPAGGRPVLKRVK
jgi:stringent starvation protein B